MNKKIIAILLILIILIVNLMYEFDISITSLKCNSESIVDRDEDSQRQIKYQKATIFKYNTEEFNELTKNLEEGTQGIYFNKGELTTEIKGEKIDNAEYNIWTKDSESILNKDKPYEGIVKSELDENNNIQFNYPEAGIFNLSTTEGKEIYTDVGLPFEYLGNDRYMMDSDIEDIHFEGGIPQSNVNMITNIPKNSYIGLDDNEYQGFFPFNSSSGEDAIYHFGIRSDINFFMTSDGKTQGPNSEDIVFEFSGDDDLWIFIDGKLVIDLGGIHDPISAEINFATKKVNVYLGLKSDGAQISKQSNLNEILGGDLGNDVNINHTLSIFYLERGAGGSNCKIEYNLPEEVKTKKFNIFTSVDGAGGTISGQDENPYEVVAYGENSVKPIIIIPKERL